MKFKKLFSVICSFSMMISSIFCCKADTVGQKVVFLGAGGVGKTQIVNQWVNGNFSEDYKPTIGAALFLKNLNTGLQAHIWDTAGAEKYRSVLSVSCRSASIAVIVADLTDDESINVISEFINLVENTAHGAKILLVGNEADLMKSEVELNQQLDKLKNKAREHGLDMIRDVIAVSARSGYNINVLENRISEILQSLPTLNIEENTGKRSKYLTGAGVVALIAGTGLLIKKYFTSNDTQKNESL